MAEPEALFVKQLRRRALAVLAVIVAAALLAAARPARLGLDLRGGTQIVLEAKDTDRHRVDGDTVNRTLEVLRRRVDQLGVAEPSLQRSGDRRIIVELPGVADPAQARRDLYVTEGDGTGTGATDTAPTVVSLGDDQARRLGAVLAGAYFRPAVAEQLETLVGGLAIDWVTLRSDSPAAGRSIAEVELRRRTGMTVVAVIRGDQALVAPIRPRC